MTVRKTAQCGSLQIYEGQASLDGERKCKKGSGKGCRRGDHQADGVPAPLITLSKKGLGWKATQSRQFLKISGIKANKARYFYL